MSKGGSGEGGEQEHERTLGGNKVLYYDCGGSKTVCMHFSELIELHI